MRNPLRPALAAIAVIAAALAVPAGAGALGLPDRAADPVVLDGSQVPSLVGIPPRQLVAFSWEDGWRQIPVQVDERAVVDYAAVRGGTTSARPFSGLAYADPGTLAGPDPQPQLDADDEIALMAMDAGSPAPAGAGPGGVERASRVRVRIADPLQPGAERFVYLYRSRTLDPAAGRSYVDYDFVLRSGDYKGTYDFNGIGDNPGPPANPEDSVVNTPYYRVGLLSRWIADELNVRAGTASGADILDGDKVQVNFSCGRAEVTFARGGGGFIANRVGPVRAIRSYIGANSGIYTQRDHVYYQRAEVATTYLRVHPGINTISQFLDYSQAATGMTYRNSRVPGGAIVDGEPDPELQTGAAVGPSFDWEQVSGPQGTLSIVNRMRTDIAGVVQGSYYEDAMTPSAPQCAGYADGHTYAASGPAVSGTGVNTDPTLGPASSFSGTRTIFFSGPGGDAELAALRARQVDEPLRVTARQDADLKKRVALRAAKRYRVKAGKRIRVRATVRNPGDVATGRVKLCVAGPKRLVRGTRPCPRIKRIAAGGKRTVRAPLRLTRRAADRKRVRARFVAEGPGIDRAVARFAIKPR